MMKDIILIFLIILTTILGLLIYNKIYVLNLPGVKRLDKYHKEFNPSLSYKFKFVTKLKEIIPSNTYQRIEDWLYLTGQISTWNVSKLLAFELVSLIAGIITSLFLLTVSGFHPLAFILAFVLIIGMPAIPLLSFYLERNKFLTRTLYQAPEFIDVLEKELVQGSGNPMEALLRAEEELVGELKLIVKDINKYLSRNAGDFRQALHLLKRRVNHPIFDQIELVIVTGYDTGRMQKMFSTLHKNCKDAIEEIIKKETTKKNLIIACVTMGLLVNFFLLFGIPFLLDILDQLQLYKNL